MSEVDDFAQGLAEMSPAGAEAPPVQAVDTPPPPPQPQEQPQEPAQPAPEGQPAPQAEPPPLDERVSRELDGRLQATLAERDKRKEAERRAQAAEAELQRFRAQQQPVQAPDAFADPEGWAAYQQRQTDERLLEMRFQMSEQLARSVHPNETVDQARDWAMQQANTTPGFAQQWMGQANPIDWAVRQHRQQQLMTKLGDVSDLDQWVEQQALARGFVRAAGAPAPSQQPMAPQVPAPTRSLASAPSAGGLQTVPTGPLASLEAVFPKQ